ncbi:MAG: AAA family ATPase, partial [Pseudomonadota bacterium]
GKSFFCIDLALHLGIARSWFDMRTREAATLYISAEGRSRFHNRIAAALTGRDIQNPPVLVLPVSFTLPDRGSIDRLKTTVIEQFSAYPSRLIIIDTMARNFVGDENQAGEIARFINACDEIRSATGAAILIVHHAGKNQQSGARGSSALLAAVDSAIEISTKDDGTRVAEIKKLRDGDTDRTFAFRLAPVELLRDDEGDPVTSCYVEPTDLPAPGSQTTKRDLALEILCETLNSKPPTVTELSLDEFKTALIDRHAIDPEASASARRQQWARIKKDLQSKNLAKIEGDRIWLL